MFTACLFLAILSSVLTSPGATPTPDVDLQEGEACDLVNGEVWTCQRPDLCRRSMIPPSNNRTKHCRHQDNRLLCCLPKRRTKRSPKALQYCRQENDNLCVPEYFLPNTNYGEDPSSFTFMRSISGGRPAEPGHYPHMVLVGYGEFEPQWKCGGSLVSESYVLTAAHCNEHPTLGAAKWARAGDLDYATDSENADPQDFIIEKIILHPDYKNPELYHDIALLKLDKEATFTKYVKPICLHHQRRVHTRHAFIAGWGRLGPALGTSSRLMEGKIPFLKVEKCKELRGEKGISSKLPRSILGESMMCAGDLSGVVDTCQGDSGGPLMILVGNNCLFTQVGITSMGGLCATPDSPGIYTRVFHYLSWIESIVWE